MENIKSSQLHRAIFLVLALLFITQVSMVSAFEFDNVKSYDPITREVIITNAFGFGAEIGKARLNTPLNVKVPVGYQKVAEFDLWAYQDYNQALKQFSFIDMKSKKKINRDYDLKYLSYEDILVKDECSRIWNKVNNSYSDYCKKEVWKKITPANLKKNANYLTIGVFTEVKEGDYIDWVPTIYGVEVEEWASWEQSLNANLMSYWKLDESIGSVIDVQGGHNGTNEGATPNVTGKVETAYDFESGESDYITMGDTGFFDLSLADTRSFSLWIKPESLGARRSLISKQNSGVPYTGWSLFMDTDNTIGFNYFYQQSGDFVLNSAEDTASITNIGDWYHIVLIYDNHALTLYVNGTEQPYTIDKDTASDVFPSVPFNFGARNNGAEFFDGVIDEVGIWSRVLNSTEIILLYNNASGLGINTTDDARPTITLNSPNSANYTIAQTLTINFTASDDIELSDVKLYVNNILNQTNASGINNSNYIFPLNLGDGDYTIYGKATDNESQETNSSSIRIVIDTIFPKINATSPIGIYDYKFLGENETLNVTFTDTHLDTCWYNYNGTNITIDGCLTGTKNSTSFILELGDTNMTIYANDTFGNLNSTFIEWTYKVLEINQTYNNETTEGSLETFLALIRLGSGYSIADAVLINYNSSSSTGQSFDSGDNTVLRKADFLIPNVDADTNITFYWNITLSDSTVLNLTSKNQTIYNLGLDNCSSFTTEIYNFTVIDEKEQTILPNATIEIAVNIYDETRIVSVLNHSAIYEKINPLRICLNRNLSNSSTYSVDVIVRYEDTGFANEYYNIVNSTLTVNSSSQIITLYDLNSTDSIEFQLSFIGSDFLPVENALVYVDRQYISENTFKTVELPKTDYNGQAVLHLVRNDVIYNIRIIKDKVILGNFENLVAFCDDFTIGDCNIELNAFDSVEGIFNYDDSLGIIFTNPTYNATTDKVSFNFVTSDGSSKTILLEVTRNDIFGNRSICNASLISSGGTLTCDIDPNIDESTLNVNVYVDGILGVKSNVQIDSTNFGVGGYLVMFVMALSFIFMFSGSKTGVLVSIGLTLASSIGMGLISGTLIGVGASGIWLLVILFIGIYKLNSERQE